MNIQFVCRGGRKLGTAAIGALAGEHFGLTSRLLLPSMVIVILAGGCGYPYYSYPYWYYPPASVAVVEQLPMTEQPLPFQREVVYPHGKYVLSGDGVNEPWHWTWVPAALSPSAGPPAPR